MTEYQCNAYAKINLSLDVVRRLENGYHEVKMIMQTVDICDRLTFRKTSGEISIATDCRQLPTDGNNLIYKAIRLMQEEYGIREGVAVKLEKNIPIAAGMAGGSADAAAALKAMNVLFDLGADRESLMKTGVRIGADVPYCIMGGTALACGIGEVLTALPRAPRCILVVAKPDISVSTKYVYEHLDETGVKKHPDVDAMVEAIKKGSLSEVVNGLGNVLEEVTVKKYPIIDSIKGEMITGGALGSLMSGSGPTVFGIFDGEEKAQKVMERLKEKKLAEQLFVTGFCEGQNPG